MEEVEILKEKLKFLQEKYAQVVKENAQLRLSSDTDKLKVKSLEKDYATLRKMSQDISNQAEADAEFISNSFIKKIENLKTEKENLARQVEQEEEFLSNNFLRKFEQLKKEKVLLGAAFEQEQECVVNKLHKIIEKMETESKFLKEKLQQSRKEKIDLEDILEQEQENLVLRLLKEKNSLENENLCLSTSLKNLNGSEEDMKNSMNSLLLDLKIAQMQISDYKSKFVQLKKQNMAAQRKLLEENLHLKQKVMFEHEKVETLNSEKAQFSKNLEIDQEREFNHSNLDPKSKNPLSSPSFRASFDYSSFRRPSFSPPSHRPLSLNLSHDFALISPSTLPHPHPQHPQNSASRMEAPTERRRCSSLSSSSQSSAGMIGQKWWSKRSNPLKNFPNPDE